MPEPAPKPLFRVPGWVAPAVFGGFAVFSWFNPATVMGWFGVTTQDGEAGLQRLGHGLAVGLAVVAVLMALAVVTRGARAERREREAGGAGT